MQSGNANVLLLLTGQTTYLQAVTQVVQARSARLADTAALFAALGGGWWNRTAPLPEKTLDVGSGEAREGRVMHGQIGGDNSESEVIPFARAERTSTSDGADQLDKAGQTILQMLHRAAGVAEENSRHALEMAQRLSHQLRAAEDRIAELEAEVTANRERAERAEQWLHRVYTEIEDRFLQQSDSRRAVNGAPQRPQNAKRSR